MMLMYHTYRRYAWILGILPIIQQLINMYVTGIQYSSMMYLI